MTKATETGAYLLVLVAAWLALFTGVIPTPTKFKEQVVPVSPWWSSVSFGSYCSFTLGYDVYSFNDKPEKYRELMEQISAAKSDSRSHGIELSN